MGEALTKTRMILMRAPGTRTFFSSDEDLPSNTEVTLDVRLDSELGTPQVLIVTVEPGDRLNGLVNP